jgi:protocatechuate 3,4-dioxygenase beta subunit
MDSDDILKGRVLSRREILGLFGAAGAAFVVACTGDDESSSPATNTPGASATEPSGTAASSGSGSGAVAATSTPVPSCVVLPELTEGPYFLDAQLDRSDIRSDPTTGAVSEGVELQLTFNLSSVAGGSCAPLSGAMVDIWHCDALGVYSGFQDNTQGFNTVNQKFLRGYQLSNANGQVKFTTIYPGWYQGRATHIHFKIRKGNEEFTSQFFFDDALSDTIAPYTQKGATGRLQNTRDNIYQQSDGTLQLSVQKTGNIYTATFDIGIQS